MQRYRHLLLKQTSLILLLLFVTASCAYFPRIIYITAAPTASQPDTKTLRPQPTQTLPQEPTQKPTEKPLSTPTLLPTKTITPTPNFNDSTFQPQSVDELQSFVLSRLNQGKKVSELTDFFHRQASTKTWTDSYAIDFDGDGKNELFFYSLLRQDNFDQNIYWIVKEVDGQYKIEYSKNENAEYGANVKIVDDFNRDDLPDLIFTRPMPGNGSGADVFMARLENTEYIIRQIATTDQIIDEIRAGIPDASGIKQIIITGFQAGWGSSGPGRTVEETFSAKGNAYELTNSRYLPSKYRIHVLQDAQVAYDIGDEKLAVKLWGLAAHDATLENYPSMWIENDIPEKYQPAYAVYRLYTHYLIIGDETNTQKYLRELNNKYPEGSPGGEFIALSHEAKRLLDISQDPEVVCDGIYEYLNSTDENVNFLMDHWYWGDHNLNIVEFCPVSRE
ncbi:MAG: VCBS repeat-containing protein [Anaerolineae bacterium]|nr:VCBS repeat-containing protein [Anaerolineae bacterium]